MGTWHQFQVDTKTLITDVGATDDLFASAAAAYVKSMLCREVDHDVILSKSYWNYYTEMRRRLLGYATSLDVGSTLDDAVKVLLPVDAQREGIQTYITQQIKNAYQELTGLDTFITKAMREIVIDLQSYIPCYRVGEETVYESTDVTQVGNMSRGPVPPQAEIREAFFLQAVTVLAENVAYQAGDYVASNGRTYMVLASGELTTGQLGAGLTTTDGSIETLGGMTFTFIYGEACFRSEVVPLPWSERFMLNSLRDGCANKDMPVLFSIDPESYSFFIWPKLDATHTLSIFWTGLKFDFEDGDTVPFDETAQQAVAEGVLAKYYAQVEREPRDAQLHGAAYAALKTRAYLDCKARQLVQYFK